MVALRRMSGLLCVYCVKPYMCETQTTSNETTRAVRLVSVFKKKPNKTVIFDAVKPHQERVYIAT